MMGISRVRAVPAHQLGQLEPVHLRHLHVDDRERDVVGEEHLERLGARAGPQEHGVVAAQQRLERDEVLLPVVDEQDLRLVRHQRALEGPPDAQQRAEEC